ncbi:hypothetical protein FBY33_0055 [Arthrobacter sp. SLBN-112]|uniref:hypothetical protein n=1 Tax=Arthrobacter sp. SLBN-112 TaxID=2768452 RepID=UPI00116CB9DF|nr:hypothetical protein [Arthrobacter sp. SLBN-112]TQJ38068.1 hypothetical protein FBY33_0055 [Arthrobacter sp. SLBN-112]
MMELMDGGRRRRRLPKRETLALMGVTALSVTAAAVLLPAVGLKALAAALPLAKNRVHQPEPEGSYLIN